MPEFDTVIRGNLVLPDRVFNNGCLAISNGRIAAIGSGEGLTARDYLDATGCIVLPGIVDGQVHTGSQAGREGIGISTRAAAAGGITTIVDMPYDDPEPVTTADRFRHKIEVVETEAHVDVALYATMAKQGGLADLEPLIEAGACAFKFSTYESHPIRFPRIGMGDLLEAFRIVAPSGLACGVHNENQEIVDRLAETLRAEHGTDPRIHAQSRPAVAECMAIADIYELGAATGCRAHVVHCSVGHGFDLCAFYKSLGVPASIETCIHYLVFNDDEVVAQGAKAKINPPLRPQEEVDRLWGHVRAGNVDFVSTDHVAWGLERKSDPDFLKNASGVPGLETLVPAFYTECVKRDIPLTTMARLLAEGPARHFLLYPKKGALQVGADADVTILEQRDFTFDAGRTLTAADWSPYHGREFAARVAATFVRGAKVWDGAEVRAVPGFGLFRRPILQ